MNNIVSEKLRYIKNNLFFEEVNLQEVAENYGTPLYVYSINQIIENFKNYSNSFYYRNHIICYAIKANSNHSILQQISKLGGGADVTSEGELFRALQAEIPPEKIVFAGVGKKKEEIIYAIKSDILLLNVESKDELDTINGIASKLNKKIDIAVRINPAVEIDTHHHIKTGSEGTKFGIPIKDALSFFDYIKRKKFINLVGLHFHIGSQIKQIEPFINATKKVVFLIYKLKKLGIEIKYLDIGGGLAIRYKDEKVPTPQQLISKLLQHIPMNLTIIAEPGRYIVGNAGILLSKVIYHKTVGKKNFLIVDASMTDLIRPAFYGSYHNIVPLKYKKTNLKKYDVVGPVCETSDFLGKNISLTDIDNDEYIAIECAGAYGFAMSSNYNSRLRPAEVIIIDNKPKLARKRDTLNDLISPQRSILY